MKKKPKKQRAQLGIDTNSFGFKSLQTPEESSPPIPHSPQPYSYKQEMSPTPATETDKILSLRETIDNLSSIVQKERKDLRILRKTTMNKNMMEKTKHFTSHAELNQPEQSDLIPDMSQVTIVEKQKRPRLFSDDRVRKEKELKRHVKEMKNAARHNMRHS